MQSGLNICENLQSMLHGAQATTDLNTSSIDGWPSNGGNKAAAKADACGRSAVVSTIGIAACRTTAGQGFRFLSLRQ